MDVGGAVQLCDCCLPGDDGDGNVVSIMVLLANTGIVS